MRTFKLYSFGKFQLYSTGLYGITLTIHSFCLFLNLRYVYMILFLGSLKSRQESVGIVFMTMVSLGKGSAQTGTQGPSGTLEDP